MINSLRGEFEAVLAGEPIAFDTTLGTVAAIEERCGAVPIVDAINTSVFGRRAADRKALIEAALFAMGRSAEDAAAIASRTAVGEAERFLLALMGALGFELTRKEEAVTNSPPLAGATTGAAGAPSPSAP